MEMDEALSHGCRHQSAHGGKSYDVCWDFIRTATFGFDDEAGMKACNLSIVSKSWVTEIPETRRFLRIWSWGLHSKVQVVWHAAVWQINSTAPSMQYNNMFKSSDIGSCMRRTGLDYTFNPHTIEFFCPGFTLPRRHDATHRQLAAA